MDHMTMEMIFRSGPRGGLVAGASVPQIHGMAFRMGVAVADDVRQCLAADP